MASPTLYAFIKSPFMVPPTLYAFIQSRVAEYQITANVHPLMQWLRGCLQDTAPVMKMLDFFDLKDRLTSGRRRLLRALVLEELPPPVL